MERRDAPPGTSWHHLDEVPAEGRVMTAVVDGRSVALTRCGGTLGALENRCPHQGGPLGEGSIENGWLRCPWHGYDYHPTTGIPPQGFSDAPEAFVVDECGTLGRPGRRARRPHNSDDGHRSATMAHRTAQRGTRPQYQTALAVPRSVHRPDEKNPDTAAGQETQHRRRRFPTPTQSRG